MKVESKAKALKMYMIGMDQNDIADIIEVQPKTVGEWAKAGKWKEKREARTMAAETNEEHVQKLIGFQLQVLDAVREVAENSLAEILTDKNTNGPDKVKDLQKLLIERGDIDALQKLHTIIRGKDTEWTTYVKIIREFMSELSEADNKLATSLTDYVNEFLNTKRKEL